jgi:excisionase family DNA binding protein
MGFALVMPELERGDPPLNAEEVASNLDVSKNRGGDHTAQELPYSLPIRMGDRAFEELLDLRQAASLLGMHWKTLEIMARRRRIPALKVGKRWRFRASALNSWLELGINSNTTNHAALTGQE